MATAVALVPDAKKKSPTASQTAVAAPATLESGPSAPAGLPRFLRYAPASTGAAPSVGGRRDGPGAVADAGPSAGGQPVTKSSAATRQGEEPETASAPRVRTEHAAAAPLEGGAATEGRAKAGSDVPRAPASPDEDPDFQRAANEVGVEARRQKKHDSEGQKRHEAENASALPEPDQIDQSSKERNTKEMEKVGAKQQDEGQRFSADQFKQDFRELVDKQEPPKTEDEVKAFSTDPPVREFPKDLSDGIAKKQGDVTRPLKRQATPQPGGGVVEKKAVEIPALVPPPAPRRVDPKLAIPKPRTDQEISVQREGDRLDAAMEDNRLSDEQLAESREPAFLETLSVKQQAARKVAETPGVYRQKEAAVLQGAEAQTDQSLASELTGMNAVHRSIGGHVVGGQHATETKTEKRQREIKKAIDDIYKDTVDGVTTILEGMATKVKEQFANGLKRQTENFNTEVRHRIGDYYGDWRIDDALFGPADVVVLPGGQTRPMTVDEMLGRGDAKRINPDVYQIFVEEKDRFVAEMGKELDAVADIVQAGLTTAHLLIQLGKLNIAIYKETLKGEERTYADQLEDEVRLKFESLESSIDDARADLLQTLADQYTDNVKQLETTFNDINDELKKSWIDRAVDFITTVGKTIYQLADLLFSILVRVAHLVWDIIEHPIRFFETLVSGLMQGIGEFVGNIGTYMQEAFWTWITGTTPVQNIRLSAASGIESLFDLVMQVLSLGPADLRAIAERVLGKEFMGIVDRAMAVGEKALEPVTILLTQGPVAFWQYLQDMLGSIIESSFDRIKESVFFAFIEKALKWVAGFFIPGGGFVKVVKAIFRAFQFVAENLENIRHFFDSVFDSMEAATEGNTTGVVGKIVAGLKLGVVLALDFLAKQLGLDRIVDGVHKIIQSLRRPIVSGIEWVLHKVKPFVMAIMRRLGIGGKEIPRAEGTHDGQLGKVVAFSAAGESHRLWIVQKGSRAVVMMASRQQPVSDQLAEYQEMASALTEETARQAVTGLIGQARQMLVRLGREADTLAKDISQPRRDSRDVEQQDRAVESDEDLLAAKLAEIREGLGLTDSQAVAAAGADDVRGRAFEALATALRTDHSWAETVDIVGAVADRLRPAGLRSLDVVPGRAGEDAIVQAEASPRLPLARLRRQATETPPDRTVTAAIRLTLAQAVDDPVGTFASAGGGPRQPTGGQILTTGTIVEAMTWNTSNIESVSNLSDAEHQFVAWLESHRHVMPLIRRIVINVFNFIPCSGCASELAGLLTEIKKVQDRRGQREITHADLYWSKFYNVRTRPTSWEHIEDLRKSGWTLHAPLDAYPPEESATKGRLALVEKGFWRLEGRSLAPPGPPPPARLAPGEERLAPGVTRRRGQSK